MLKHSVTRVKDLGRICRVIQATFVLHNIAQKGGDIWEIDEEALRDAHMGNGTFNEARIGGETAMDATLRRNNIVENYFTVARN